MIKKILLTVTVLMLFGCVKDLKDSERAWNPYSLNEVLVFESSEKELDTLVIQEIYDAVSDGPTPKLYYYTSLFVYAERLNSKNKLFSKKRILNVSSSTPEITAKISFPLYFENAKFSGWGLELKELEKYPTQLLITKAGAFDDAIKIRSIKHRLDRENSILYMYWSKKHGYIKFERADGFTWELVDKYIPK